MVDLPTYSFDPYTDWLERGRGKERERERERARQRLKSFIFT